MTRTEFQEKIFALPQQAGVYKYYDEDKNLLYVGKAKNLKKRVSSYFTKTFVNGKTRELVKNIFYIEFTLVDSEQDAFLLENSLIKQYKPKFNIDLKDDKSYPFIVIKKEPFPRLFFTRKRWNDGSEYLGPYTSVGRVRELVEFIKYHIPLRTCSLPLTQTNIEKKKFKRCLEYHLGNCKGPCEGLQSEAEYNESLRLIKNMLKGNLQLVLTNYKKEMEAYMADLHFEAAARVKAKIEHLKNYQSKSVIVSSRSFDADVFSIIQKDAVAFVNFLQIKNGAIIQTHTAELQTKLGEREAETLAFAIAQIRDSFNSDSKEIIVPIKLPALYIDVAVTIPLSGIKKKLLDLSFSNTQFYLTERTKPIHKPTVSVAVEVLKQLKIDLNLKKTPTHIECFDNSNFQGSHPVSALVCFINGMPSKENYRHYNIKTVVGIDDFATMREVVWRRYKRLLSEGKPLPQLIIIDGGKGQLNAALQSIQTLGLEGQVTLVGLAKNKEELFFVGDTESVQLDWNGSSLKFIKSIRNEVHRFGIGFHRKKRSMGTFKNEFESIPGIGAATAERLLKRFKSAKQVKQKDEKEIAAVVGQAKAAIIQSYFDSTKPKH